ncbi:hypothetical protein IGJ55_002076 [Enterococcus sp. AZ170]|uniref:SGNH/GDSL hydrolase family protein n=1 Tax=unclassified Enterococcus TaxID=2608891 RepID=UPI003D2BE054
MAIDQFKTVDVVITNINEDYIPQQLVVQGERSGRSMTLQIANGGKIENQAGISVNLGWSHDTVKNNDGEKLQGLDAFQAIDKTKGLFRLDYPASMVQPGQITAVIQIISSYSDTRSKPFKIKVERTPFDSKAVESENSFTALQEALGTVNKYDGKIGDLEYNKAEKKDLVNTENKVNDKIEKLEYKKAEKSELLNVENKVNNLGSATPKETFSSLNALQTKYPSGSNFAMVVLEADGKTGYVYLWDGSSWQKGALYQAQGLADKSVSSAKISDAINMKNYPFSPNSSFEFERHQAAILDIKLYDADINKDYCIAGLFKNNDKGVWRIFLNTFDQKTGIVGDNVALWQVTNYIPQSNIETIELNKAAGGFDAEITIDWSKLLDGDVLGTGVHGAKLLIHKLRYIDKFEDVQKFPFANDAIVGTDRLKQALLDVKLIGADVNKDYAIGGLFKNSNSRWRLLVFEYDKATAKLGNLVSEFNTTNYVPSADIERLKLSTTIYEGTFISEILIDWSKLNDGDLFGTNVNGDILIFDKRCTVASATSKVLPKTLYPTKNDNTNFPNYAYFLGNWEKRKIRDLDVMSSTLPSCGMMLGFYGQKLEGLFYKETNGIKITVRIDNGEPFEMWINDDNTPTLIAENLTSEEHVVEIYQDPWFGKSMTDKHSFYNYKGCINVQGFVQDTYPIFTPGTDNVFYFYGDSFTAGGGANLAQSYATFCSDYLGAQAIRIAQGGAALVERSDRLWVPTLPEFAFHSSVGKRARPQQANIVFINIGTNDTPSAVSLEKYESVMIEFLTHLKQRHPGSPIVLMNDWLKKYTTACQNAAVKVEGVYYVDVSTWVYDKLPDLHPTLQGHQQIGRYLANSVTSIFRGEI